MADAWIKMRVSLVRSPKLLRVAAALNIPKAHALGAVFMLWAMADEQTTNGLIRGLTFDMLDKEIGIMGFCEALANKDVDWARLHDKGVLLPNWGRHNGSTAKKRAQTARRVAAHKERSGNADGNAPSVTESLAVRDLEQEQAKSKEEEEKKEAKASPSESGERSPSANREPRTPIELPASEKARQGALCSLLLAQIPAMTPRAAAAIVGRRGVGEAHVAWAIERTLSEIKLREGGPQRVQNPAGYCRTLIENEKPPAGWIEQYNRQRIAAMRTSGGTHG